MKQPLILAVLALSIAAFAPVSSHQCRQVREQVMQPLKNVITYFQMGPDLDNLSGPGCLYILQQMKSVPHGAEILRQLASQKVENTQSRCLDSVNSVQYICNEPEAGKEARCVPQAYSYCGQWEYSMTNQESRYELTMELAYKLDTAYDKAQAICGMAMRWDRGAMDAARDLLAYLGGDIRESGEKAYEISCAE